MELSDVRTEPAGDRWSLVFTRHLRHPREQVWRMLTDPAELDGWSPFTADRDLGTLGAATLTMIDGDERVDLPAQVVEARAPELLEYTWGDDLLRWELATDGDGTRLTLRHTLADRDMVAKVAAGWHLCLAVAGRRLAGEPAAPIRGQAAMDHGWQELHDRYESALKKGAGSK